ncbi:MAG: hypothetical protein FD180_1476 [Planctomycetota bacterium]|nr:MAG: hypothetical protein FD180_1476 [Planctomycetota bacterium]
MTKAKGHDPAVFPPPMDLPKLNSVEEVVSLLRRGNHRLYVRPAGEIPRSPDRWYVARNPLPSSAADPLVRIHRTESAAPGAEYLGACFDGIIQGDAIAEVPESVCTQIESKLDSDEPIRWLSTRPIVRTFLYLDISDFSTYPPGQQALIVACLPKFVSEAQKGRRAEHTGTPQQMICTGDGYIFVFLDPVAATWFAAQLATEIDYAVAKPMGSVEIHYRMGIHIGEVFPFEEGAERNRWNFAGDGINGGRRVLDAIGRNADDLVFLSGDVVKSIHAKAECSTGFGEIMQYLVNRGRRKDKHKKPWRVYELNHRDAASNSRQIKPS